MPEHLHYDDDAIFNPETHHEKSDVNVRALLWSVAFFVLFGIITHFVVMALYSYFAGIERGNATAPLTGVQRPADAGVPAEPRLQPFPRTDAQGQVTSPNRNTPVTDLIDMRAAEDKVLTTYGWVDKQKGVVRVPIDVAKRTLVQRGLPVNTGAQSLPPAATNLPGAEGALPATSTAEGAPAATNPAQLDPNPSRPVTNATGAQQ